MLRLDHGARVPAEGLRVFADYGGPVSLRTAGGEIFLAPGDVVVAQPEDGEIRGAGERCALISDGGALSAAPRP